MKALQIARQQISYTTETVPETLEDYQDWQFSSGCTTGQDFKRFSRLFRNDLKRRLKGKGLQIVNYNSTGHYFVSGFVSNGQQYVYFLVSDVRHFPGGWLNNILVRTAKHEKDYTGGSNTFCTLEKLPQQILNLL